MADLGLSILNSQPNPIIVQQLLDHMKKIESDNAALKDIATEASSLSIKLCDRVVKLEANNILLRDQIGILTTELTNLKQSTENLSQILSSPK